MDQIKLEISDLQYEIDKLKDQLNVKNEELLDAQKREQKKREEQIDINSVFIVKCKYCNQEAECFLSRDEAEKCMKAHPKHYYGNNCDLTRVRRRW